MDKLQGTWKLMSVQFELADTGEAVDMYGRNPLGSIVFTADRRMMTIITAGDRQPPKQASDDAALFNSMMAYSGPYRIEGEDQFVTSVDLAWHPAWIGTEQARFFAVDGDTLSVTTALVTHPMFPGRSGRGVLKWRRG